MYIILLYWFTNYLHLFLSLNFFNFFSSIRVINTTRLLLYPTTTSVRSNFVLLRNDNTTNNGQVQQIRRVVVVHCFSSPQLVHTTNHTTNPTRSPRLPSLFSFILHTTSPTFLHTRHHSTTTTSSSSSTTTRVTKGRKSRAFRYPTTTDKTLSTSNNQNLHIHASYSKTTTGPSTDLSTCLSNQNHHTPTYNETDVQVLGGLEAVRKRPVMDPNTNTISSTAFPSTTTSTAADSNVRYAWEPTPHCFASTSAAWPTVSSSSSYSEWPPPYFSSLPSLASYLRETVREWAPAHAAMGVFDGVHVGHQAVLGGAVRRTGAEERTRTGMGAEDKLNNKEQMEGGKGNENLYGNKIPFSVVLSFSEHPRNVLHSNSINLPHADHFSAETNSTSGGSSAHTTVVQPIVHDNGRKAQILKSWMGMDFVVLQQFDKHTAAMSPSEFFQQLIESIPNLKSISVGAGFRFGQGGRGSVQTLVDLCKPLGIDVISIGDVCLNQERISSTSIRRLLRMGAVEEARKLLGWPYRSYGVTSKGQQLGRTIGFPTINLEWMPVLRPRFGVYFVRLWDRTPDGGLRSFDGVANYGVRPTVSSVASVPVLETHLLDDNYQCSSTYYCSTSSTSMVATNRTATDAIPNSTSDWDRTTNQRIVDDLTHVACRNSAFKPNDRNRRQEKEKKTGVKCDGSLSEEKEIIVDWIKFVREERKFQNLNELQQQLKKDKEAAIRFFSEI